MKNENQESQHSHKEKEVILLNTTENKVFYQRVDKATREFQRLAKKVLSSSETKSLYSNIPPERLSWNLGGLKGLTAREAMGIALYLPLINKEWSTFLRLELEQLAYKYKYQGLWRKTHKLLRLYQLNEMIYFFIEEIASESELFGNYRKLALQRLKKINLYDPNRTPIVEAQRKRGYNDHGSRREDHKWLPKDIHLGANPIKEDYRESYGNKKKSLFSFLWRL